MFFESNFIKWSTKKEYIFPTVSAVASRGKIFHLRGVVFQRAISLPNVLVVSSIDEDSLLHPFRCLQIILMEFSHGIDSRRSLPSVPKSSDPFREKKSSMLWRKKG